MKKNHIEKIRKNVKRFFDPGGFVEGSEECFESPNGHYRLETSNYLQSKEDLNWHVTRMEIYNNLTNEKLFDFFGNDERFFHQWLTKDAIDYLICAEDLLGGQTVIDLTNKHMESYSPGEDGFIWTEFHLSPNGKVLATVGCYWACPYVIKTYDFQDPLTLPLKELNEVALVDNNEEILGWLDNEHVITDKRKALYVTKVKC